MAFTDLHKRILLRIGGRRDCRLFRNQVGHAWQGDAEPLQNGAVLIRHARRLMFGLCVGSSDTIGWCSLTVTPAMVGQNVAVFLALEAKEGRGRTTTEQDAFIAAVQRAGGIAGVARSEQDAENIVDAYKAEKLCNNA